MTVAIVGSGPAGMLAAILIARTGESVHLFDEQANLGGHFTYDRYPLPGGARSADLLAELETAVRASSVGVKLGSVAWAAFGTDTGIELSVSHKGAQETVHCGRVIVATGTTDRAIAIPGCTLPGVMTARAGRILAERYGVVPGERFAIVGAGAEAERLAGDVARWGARVELIADVNSVRAISGRESVRAIETEDGSTDVDIVVIAAGELPDIQLPGMLGVERLFDAALGGWRILPSRKADVLSVIGGAALGAAEIGDVLAGAVEAAAATAGPYRARALPELIVVRSVLEAAGV